MIYLKHPTLGNAHFPVEQLLELESQGWVWWPHGEHLTRPVFAAPTAAEPSLSSLIAPTPTGAAPIPADTNSQLIVKRKPGRPRKA